MPALNKKRFLGLGTSKRRQEERRQARAAKSRRRVQLESLEDRRLLALLGVLPELPILTANNTGEVSYDATSDLFVATADPLTFKISSNPFFPGLSIQPASDFLLKAEIDSSGNLVGGVAGHDFEVSGSIDIDGDGTFDVTGTLLTGEVLAFGFRDSGTVSSTDDFDFRIQVTGGALAMPGTLSGGGSRPDYFANSDIGLQINSENSTFTNDFNVDFGGGNKSTFGPIDKLAELGNYVWVDANQNGLQDDGNTGVNDVTVDLYVDVDGDGVAEPGGDDGGPVATTTTADLNGTPGYYLFPNLDPGDYFVVFDPTTLPTGFEFTTQDVPSDDAVDSDADTTTGIAAVTTLDAGESDLTWDAGIFQAAVPAIDIEKCVEHTVVGPGQMHVLDFNDLATGTVVDDEYSSLGVTISVQNARSSHPDKAIVFDSANPTGGDNDLATPGYHSTNTTPLGNVLIIAENDVDANNDQLVDNPDDEASGGTITFDFDSPVRIDQIDLLDVDSSEVGGSVVTVNTANGSQSFNIAALGDNSFQSIDINVDNVTSLSVNFISSGAITGLKFTKPSESLECDDADVGPGPSFNVGDSVTFNYTVTNAGDVDLKIVEVSDDNATPGNTSDDFNPLPVLNGVYNIGDTDQDGELDLTEAWQYTYTITATTAGQFTNISDVLGNPVDDPDVDVVDDDPANYVVVGDPGIQIEKFTNGVDAEDESQAAQIAPGDTVTWTYEVTNTGEVAFTAAEISIIDDNGTPAVSGDDFGIGLEYNGSEIVYDSGDGGDGILSPGETWTYIATGTALALPGGTVGSAITFDFAGSSSTDGTDGNTRSYSAGGVDVDVRAFSRDKSNGNWTPAYLGSYGGGLGVTDSSEGSGGSNMHTVDNVGRDNYVLFEYSEQVVVDAAYLGYVVNDSDITVWIGNATVPLTGLSDAVLSSLGFTEVNLTNSSSARWADLNAGEVAGNVLVIAAKTDDSTPEDRFKIEHVKVYRTASGCYENMAVVTAGGVSDSDASYYCNPEVVNAGIDIEKFVKVDSGQTGGGEGLTPGFWKTHSPAGPAPLSGWPETGFSHLDNYNTVFGVSDDSGLTLLDALGRGGGGTNALGRHATAALLNAANPNVDYSYTQAEVISLTQAAYGSGDASLIETTKNLFAVQNELGADLSTPANVPDSGMDDFGVDADSGSGPAAQIGDQVVFTYFVTNPGDVELYPVVVVDDNATTNTGDDFQPSAVEENDGNGNFFNVGDDDQDGRLDPGETWLYQEAITVTMAGQFTNIGSVSGTPVDQNGDPVGPDVSDDDPANYNVAGGTAGIDIEKLTNGEDADTPGTAVEIAAGQEITWTYKVTNTGTTHFNQSDVVVTDDNGTSQTGDDLSSVADGNVEITLIDQGDNDGVLAPGEVWTYAASGTAEQLSGGITGDAVTVYLTGGSSTSGAAGNSRTFTSGGVSVTASAFSRDDDANWSTAYLGAYSSGLGVTDGSEGSGGNGRHRVDNTGRMNYVVFEFSENVVVDKTYLDSVVHDSDITAWIGSVDGAVDLNDAVLALLAKESNDTGSSSSRWADLNNGQVAGNVLVIAASVDDSTPEDNFKIRKLKFYRTAGGVYTNLGTVEAGGVSDSDLSHYVNPDQAVATGEIGNYVWNDVNRNGKQDSGEPGLSGVTVNLLDVDQNVVATTTTNSAGLYSFSGLDAGQYFVKFIAPQDMVFSPQGQGDHADHGSNANSDGQTDKIYLAENEIDNTIDAGLYAAAVDLMFEAEDYEWIDAPWQVRSSSSASGGEYIKAPNGTGSYYNTPPSHSKVTYQFDVTAEGNYEISALVRASRSSDNSVWVKVDDQPWVQWHMDLTGSSFKWQAVTDGWDQRATQFHLTPGQHSLQLRVREDGVKLDKFMVSKLSTTTVVIDALATSTDLDSVAWEVGVDSEGNEYLLTANGTGSHYSTLSGDELSYDFTVDQDGEYQMHALVNALNSSDNSFWISIDGGQWIQWHLSVTNGQWQWQTVSDGSSHDQVSFDLSAGSHTLKIKVREDGTMLDKIVISNDSSLDLDSIG